MKGYTAIIILVLATCVATYLFQQKHKDSTLPIDTHAKGLATIIQMLPNNAYVHYDTLSIDYAIFSRARYILAPRNLVIAKKEVDTLLSIIKIVDYESNNYTILPKVLSSSNDGEYHYILSSIK